MPPAGDPKAAGSLPTSRPIREFFINYFDCSDDQNPRRKYVFILPTETKDGMHVRQWNADSREWEDEGFDYDRDLPQIFQAAFTVIGTVGAVAPRS